jgi:hypothetical protein
MRVLLALFLLVLRIDGASVQIAVTQKISSIAMSDAKPPARSAAFIKALEDAHALLNQTDSEPKEVNAVLQMLQDIRISVMELPRGSKVWCPSLEVSL